MIEKLYQYDFKGGERGEKCNSQENVLSSWLTEGGPSLPD